MRADMQVDTVGLTCVRIIDPNKAGPVAKLGKYNLPYVNKYSIASPSVI